MTTSALVYFNPQCSKSRRVRELLEERGVAVRLRHYLEEPAGRGELELLLHLLGTDDPRVILRQGDTLYDSLGLAEASPEACLQALVEHPALLERPIVVAGGRAVVARPPERIASLFPEPAEPLQVGTAQGTLRYLHGGRVLSGGEPVQLCCSGGWLTGRFEATGVEHPARFFFSIELGAGQVEQLSIELPTAALLRRTVTV